MLLLHHVRQAGLASIMDDSGPLGRVVGDQLHPVGDHLLYVVKLLPLNVTKLVINGFL